MQHRTKFAIKIKKMYIERYILVCNALFLE